MHVLSATTTATPQPTITQPGYPQPHSQTASVTEQPCAHCRRGTRDRVSVLAGWPLVQRKRRWVWMCARCQQGWKAVGG